MRPDSKIALCDLPIDDGMARGLFRRRAEDGDLFSIFDLYWSMDIDPTGEGELSPQQSDGLLRRLKSREVLFEAQMALLTPQDSERYRQRYQSLREFLKSAVDQRDSIYLIE